MTYFIQPCASWWAFELFVPLGMNNALMNVCVTWGKAGRQV